MTIKIQVLSDLHNEFAEYEYQETDADYVVLAGDIGPNIEGVKWAIKSIKNKPVIYICGNHEYWGCNITKLDKQLLDYRLGTNVTVLNNIQSHIEFQDVIFIGATMWTDYCLHGEAKAPFAKLEAGLRMNDFRKVTYGSKDERITPDVLQGVHYTFIDKAKELLNHFKHWHNSKPIVMVTHHAPHQSSISPLYDRDTCNPAYASDLSKMMWDNDIKLWCHGHIHASNDYILANTRVISNPRGYAGYELNPGFKDKLVMEV